jgi:hypothetical protein
VKDNEIVLMRVWLDSVAASMRVLADPSGSSDMKINLAKRVEHQAVNLRDDLLGEVIER